MKRVFPLLGAAMLMVQCATIHYLGESYPPTGHVDLYFSEADIPKEYKIMGRIEATADADELIYSTEKFTDAILEKAGNKGADGVVILDFKTVQTGVTRTDDRTRTTEKTEDGKVTRNRDTHSTTVEEKRRIEALVVKYRE
jgi:hypothetical protein